VQTCDQCGHPLTDDIVEELKLQFPVLASGPAAEVPAALWQLFTEHRELARQHDEAARLAERQIRQIAESARILTVSGQPVARRVTQAATNISWNRDFYRRVRGVPGE
jgi:hypothetical protein